MPSPASPPRGAAGGGRLVAPSATVGIADEVTRLRASGEDVVDFSAGRAAEHTPDYIVRAAVTAMEQGDTHQTMARGTLAYREACARKLSRENGLEADPEREIVATLGCKEGLFAALLATLSPGDEVLVEDPGFVSYQPAIQYCGGVAVPVPTPWSEEALEPHVTEKTRALLLCSPHNPTGTVHTETALRSIAGLARRRDLWVYADETYERVTWGGRSHVSIATLEGMRERTINLMGLTKSFSMGGWRIGFARAPEDVLERMVTVQQHLVTCAGSFAQAAASVAYGEPTPVEVRELWADWEKRCLSVCESIAGIEPLKAEPPEGAFYAWVDARALGEPSERVARRWLDEQRVAVVPGSAFGPSGEGFLRITCVRSWDEIEDGMERIRRAVEERR